MYKQLCVILFATFALVIFGAQRVDAATLCSTTTCNGGSVKEAKSYCTYYSPVFGYNSAYDCSTNPPAGGSTVCTWDPQACDSGDCRTAGSTPAEQNAFCVGKVSCPAGVPNQCVRPFCSLSGQCLAACDTGTACYGTPTPAPPTPTPTPLSGAAACTPGTSVCTPQCRKCDTNGVYQVDYSGCANYSACFCADNPSDPSCGPPPPPPPPPCSATVICSNFSVKNEATGQSVTGVRLPGAPNTLTATAGQALTLSGKSGAGNTDYVVSCQGEPTVSTAEFTVVDKATTSQVGKCYNGFSDTSSNIFSAFFCRGLETIGAFKDPNSGVLSNTHNWPATGLTLQHGRITDPSIPNDTVLMGACTKDGWAQWCSNLCPGTQRNATTWCNYTCDSPNYKNLSDACKIAANGLSDAANQQARNAKAQFVPSTAGNYRLLDTAYTARGAGGTDTTPCAVDVQVGTGTPLPANCKDLGGGLAADPTASTYNNALNVFVLGNDSATYMMTSDANGSFPTTFSNLGGTSTGAPRSIVDSGTLYAFVNGNGGTYYKYSADGFSNPWHNTQNTTPACKGLGGVLTSNPSATTYNGQMYVFTKGSDNAIYVRTSDTSGNFPPDTAPGAWTNLGGVLTGDPQSIVNGSLLYVYALGRSSPSSGFDTWYYQTFDGSTWSGWTQGGPGGSTTSTASLNGRTYQFSKSAVDSSLQVCDLSPTPTPLGIATTAQTNATAYLNGVRYDFRRSPTNSLWVCNPSGTVSGNVNNDLNANGAPDPNESGFQGITVTLTNSAGTPPSTATTDPNGNFTFPTVTYGNYTITAGVPSGYTSSTQNPVSIPVSSDMTVNFGLTPLYQISGSVFMDNNKNGKKDPGENYYASLPSITSSRGVIQSDPGGTFIIKNLLSSFTYGPVGVTYTTFPLPTGYIMTYPLNGPPPSYSVQVGKYCSPSPVSPNRGDGACQPNTGDIYNLNFGITNRTPWLQGMGLDMRFDQGFDNRVPSASCPTTGDIYTEMPSNPSNPLSKGIVFIGDSLAANSFGARTVPSFDPGWVVDQQFPEAFKPVAAGTMRTSYTYLYNAVKRAGFSMTPLNSYASCANLANCDLNGLTKGIYTAEGDVVLNTTNFSTQNYVILIKGTLRIKGEIKVPIGGTVTFAVGKDASGNGGTITIDKSVGTSPTPGYRSNTGQVQGFYTADTSIILEGTNDCTIGPDKMLNLEGAFVTNGALGGGQFLNNRDLCADNLCYPGVTIKERPDFFLFAPDVIKQQTSIYREIAP